MCKARELNKKSREVINNGTMKGGDVISYVDGFSEFLLFPHKGSKDLRGEELKEELTKRIAGMQIIMLALCGKHGISDEEVIEAACKIFDEYDESNKNES